MAETGVQLNVPIRLEMALLNATRMPVGRRAALFIVSVSRAARPHSAKGLCPVGLHPDCI